MRILTFFVFILFLPLIASAQLRLASIFGDHMVLQRNKPILFWGFNSPETRVKIKFADQEVEVKTNTSGRWEVSFPARNIGSPLTLSISDTGIGIKRDYYSKIFDKFYRINPDYEYEGVGIGLYISEKIIQFHNGSIDLVSSPEKGSEFNINIKIENL